MGWVFSDGGQYVVNQSPLTGSYAAIALSDGAVFLGSDLNCLGWGNFLGFVDANCLLSPPSLPCLQGPFSSIRAFMRRARSREKRTH